MRRGWEGMMLLRGDICREVAINRLQAPTLLQERKKHDTLFNICCLKNVKSQAAFPINLLTSTMYMHMHALHSKYMYSCVYM